jgi:hypothetical protein
MFLVFTQKYPGRGLFENKSVNLVKAVDEQSIARDNLRLGRWSPVCVRLSPGFGLSGSLPLIWVMKRFDWTRLFMRPYKILTQLLFWILVFCLYFVLKEYPQRLKGAAMVCLILQETLELAIPSYSQNLLVLPFFRRGQRMVGAILYLAQAFALIYLLPYVLNGVGTLFGVLFDVRDRVDWREEHITFSVIAFTIVATVFKMATDKFIRDKEQKENELRHLKSQLNPHFLFNTLNNLYGLSVAESKRLPDLMLKLSDLLRYSLYDTGQDYVPLQKELDYIGNYVELERIRLSDRTEIIFETEGETGGQHIAPLLLIIFIENCFKHFSTARGQRGFVRIRFVLRDGWLQMNVKNSLDPAYDPDAKRAYAPGGNRTIDKNGNSAYDPNEKRHRAGGLGLNNVKQRLDLIYPYKHVLEISRAPEFFEVSLKINLN